MSDESSTPETAASQTAPIVPSAPPSAPSAPPDESTVRMSPAALKARLDEERSKGRAALLKEFGFEKHGDLAAVLKAAKDAEDAKLSEMDRLRKQLDEYKPKVERLSALEQRVASMVDAQFSALPENIKSAIDGVANGDPEERLRMIDVFRKAGMLNPSQPVSTAQPIATPASPAALPAPLANTAGQPPPRPAPVKTKFDEWQDLLKTNPVGASIFFRSNKAAIEASRPARP